MGRAPMSQGAPIPNLSHCREDAIVWTSQPQCTKPAFRWSQLLGFYCPLYLLFLCQLLPRTVQASENEGGWEGSRRGYGQLGWT